MAVAPDGDLYVLDGIRVLRVRRDGRLAAVVNRRSFRVMPPGDRVPAVEASIDGYGGGMAFDRDGNLYIAEVNTHRIRKVSADGIISTIAGSGPAPGPGSLSGDGGPALEARLNRPIDIAVDGANNLFILDMGNNRIRKIDAGGTITTHAVLGPIGFWSQLALDAEGELFVSDRSNHRILRVGGDGSVTTVAGTGQAGFSGDGGPAREAQFIMPSGIAFDAAGTLYIADSGNHRVRKVTPR
jgi:sugar lactone lactonase YvrE